MAPAPDVIVFDMDGVLVEVTASYREAIRATVKHFTGDEVSHQAIQDFKNRGGWNNDWDLSHRLITERGKQASYDDVVTVFNEIFFGRNGDGLIQCEEWVPANGFFDELSRNATLAIFTGRLRYEADATLDRFAKEVAFDPIVTADDVANPKPAADGLHLVMARHPGKTLWYLGDTIDDARSAQAANVPFVGVAAPANPRHAELVDLLRQHDAIAVLNDVNELPGLVREAKR